MSIHIWNAERYFWGHRLEVPSTQLIFFLPFWCGRLLSSVISASTRLSIFYNFSPYRCGITYKIPFQTSPFAENRSGMVRVDLSYHVPLMCTYLQKLSVKVGLPWLSVSFSRASSKSLPRQSHSQKGGCQSAGLNYHSASRINQS